MQFEKINHILFKEEVYKKQEPLHFFENPYRIKLFKNDQTCVIYVVFIWTHRFANTCVNFIPV